MPAPILPAHIPRTQILAAIRSLAIDPVDLVRAEITTDSVTVTLYDLNEDGRVYVAPGTDELATTTTTIPTVAP